MKQRSGYAIIFAIAASLLAACGDPEPEQRKAFIAFLQTRILDKPGVHVPQLTPDETTAFGPYALGYAVITDFNHVLNQSVSPKLTAAMATGSIGAFSDLVAKRGAMEAARATMHDMAAALGDDIAHADAAHAALRQPPEVKAVFDKAYDRLVKVPAATLRDVAPVAEQTFTDALELAAFLDEHKTQIVASGATLQTSSASLRDAINTKLQKLQASQQAVQRAQSALQAMVYGTGG